MGKLGRQPAFRLKEVNDLTLFGERRRFGDPQPLSERLTRLLFEITDRVISYVFNSTHRIIASPSTFPQVS